MWRRRVLAVLALAPASAACGDDLLPDGVPLEPAAHLAIVAHPDDDLLFLQPDLLDALDDRAGITNVYVTGGDRGLGADAANARYRGLREAYAAAAGLPVDAWACGYVDVVGHPAEHCRLDDARLSLVFLGYPDGGKEGDADASLLRLWQGTIASAETIGQRTARYDQAGLVDAVADLVHTTAPATLRTLDIAGTHGRDHADHLVVGALALAGVAEAGWDGELLAFRGYGIDGEPARTIDPMYDRARELLARYDACATACDATCGGACSTIDPQHESWLRRRYAIGFRTDLRGSLRGDAGCVTADAHLGTCAAIELTTTHALRIASGCLASSPSGEVTVAACAPVAAQRWFLDDEGHLWNGRPAAMERVTADARAACLVSDGERLRVDACGAERAPTWALTRDAELIARPAWLPRTGRELRVHDRDLYFVAAGELQRSTDLAAPVRVGPLAIDPESLVIAELAGQLRACGRDASGLLCRTLGSDAAPARWSAAFAQPAVTTATDRSLAAMGDEICGLDDQGVLCAPRGLTATSNIRSRWPARDALVWLGDLDGDHAADWCAATPAGPACGRDRDRALTTDGVPWAYVLGGTALPSPANASIGALHDLDGDGRDDLCSVRDRRVTCARSQGTSFGPEVVLGTIPAGAPATGLWFHAGRACVDDGTTLACLPLP